MKCTQLWTLSAFEKHLQSIPTNDANKAVVYMHLSFEDERFIAAETKEEKVISKTIARVSVVCAEDSQQLASCEATLSYYNDFITDPIIDPFRKIVSVAERIRKAGFSVVLGYQSLDTSLTTPITNLLSFVKYAEIYGGPAKRDQLLNMLAQIFDDFKEFQDAIEESSAVRNSARKKLASFVGDNKKDS